jgi:hypothetical protein
LASANIPHKNTEAINADGHTTTNGLQGELHFHGTKRQGAHRQRHIPKPANQSLPFTSANGQKNK